ncbi:MAG TPA: SDR family oxidoreductase [Saprospiraceae bacterium]|nr:SDR family oxidoreductase [Saprospiraceae bacterium]
MYNPFSLAGKTIFVTGASSGIGRSIAMECSKMGASLIITGRNEERLNETLSQMYGGQHTAITADILSTESIQNLIEKLPALDGIVQNAGINNKVPVKFISIEKIDAIFRTNYYAPVLIVQSLLKAKKINKGASIVMMSSISTNYAAVTNAIYSSSKGAINSFSKVLALELAPRNIRVNVIQPGIIKTDILKAYALQDDLAEHEKDYPLGKFGEPEDIAYFAIYLLSDAAKWVTGSIFTIDGGVTLR